jgi:hypothetical protein
MHFSSASLISLLPQLGAYLKQGVDYYAALRLAGKEVSAAVVSVHLAEKMATWDPKISGVVLLDDETRNAAARFIAGVAVNIASA